MSPDPSPFPDLIQKLQSDLDRAAETCAEIKKTRHVGLHHKNLDELEEALSAGSAIAQQLAAEADGIPGADADGEDGIAPTENTSQLRSATLTEDIAEPARKLLTGYLKQVGEIKSRLETIAHPNRSHHSKDQQHHQRDLLLLLFVPPQHEQKEYPHFHHMKLKWEKVRDGLTRMLAEMKIRLANDIRDTKGSEDAADPGPKVNEGTA